MIELELVSRFGEPVTLWVRDTTTPFLEDPQGRPVMDYGPMFPQPYSIDNPPGTHPAKFFLDAFLMRPSPGLYTQWIQMPNTTLYKRYHQAFAIALYVITGKFLRKVTWYEPQGDLVRNVYWEEVERRGGGSTGITG